MTTEPRTLAIDIGASGLNASAGKGLELVVTLGTGFGTAVFVDGWLAAALDGDPRSVAVWGPVGRIENATGQ